MNVIETERLALRELNEGDAEFIFGLVNQPSWLEFIGDRGVRTLDDARAYIKNGPVASYAAHGFGLYRTALRDSDVAIGICGLLKRDSLPDPDIGFALLPDFWRSGYALEAASAVMSRARLVLEIPRVLAITSQHNTRSIRLLEKIGFSFSRLQRMKDDADEVNVYESNLIA